MYHLKGRLTLDPVTMCFVFNCNLQTMIPVHESLGIFSDPIHFLILIDVKFLKP